MYIKTSGPWRIQTFTMTLECWLVFNVPARRLILAFSGFTVSIRNAFLRILHQGIRKTPSSSASHSSKHQGSNYFILLHSVLGLFKHSCLHYALHLIFLILYTYGMVYKVQCHSKIPHIILYSVGHPPFSPVTDRFNVLRRLVHQNKL